MTVLDELQGWRDLGGPAVWRAAWGRTLELLRPRWGGVEYDPLLVDGGAALTVGLYIVACEQEISPAEVRRIDVENLNRPASAEGLAAHWRQRLQRIGHDLEDADDPVSVCWRELARDCSPPHRSEGLEVEPGLRWGPAIGTALPGILSRWRALQF